MIMVSMRFQIREFFVTVWKMSSFQGDSLAMLIVEKNDLGETSSTSKQSWNVFGKRMNQPIFPQAMSIH